MAVFGVSIVFISGLLFELSDLLIIQGAKFAEVFRLLVYALPGILVETLPLSVLFASFLSLGRLARDRELMVIQLSGSRFSRIILPLTGVALLISISSYTLNETVVPWSNHHSENIIRQISFRDRPVTVTEDVFFKAGANRYFYVHRVDEGTEEMQNILIYETARRQFPSMIVAQQGYYHEDSWDLYDGVIHEFDSKGFVNLETSFEKMTINVDPGFTDFFGRQKRTYEMTRSELKEQIEIYAARGSSVARYLVDYHLKLSVPFAGLIFLLLGAPLSLRSAKSGMFFGVAISIGISFLYYVVLMVLRTLAGNGQIDPFIAAWFPNIVFALVGTGLIIKRNKN